MIKSRISIAQAQAVTAYGDGADALISGIYASISAVGIQNMTPKALYEHYPVGCVPGVTSTNRTFEILERLASLEFSLPEKAPIYLATTIGAINMVEQRVDNLSEDSSSHLSALVRHVKKLFGDRRVVIVSGACAASACAIAKACSDIHAVRTDEAIVVSCDSLSEFIFSGFASLGGLDQQIARPFDKDRAGLNLGEAAALMVLRTNHSENDDADIVGWSLSTDACHVTSPDQNGCGLARAIRNALKMSGHHESAISYIAAHGTGTVYNDNMELAAFKNVFDTPVPTSSIKWGTGHTVAAAGMIQLIVALHAKKHGTAPPNALTRSPDEQARDWISTKTQKIDHGPVLSVNSGFGGINCALVLD